MSRVLVRTRVDHDRHFDLPVVSEIPGLARAQGSLDWGLEVRVIERATRRDPHKIAAADHDTGGATAACGQSELNDKFIDADLTLECL